MNKKIFSITIQSLINSLKLLPGIGQKNAERMAIFLLKNKKTSYQLSTNIKHAIEYVKYCKYCNILCENHICDICSSKLREEKKICVVENMLDVNIIEKSSIFFGKYFILHGCISPLDDIGPEELQLYKLKDMIIKNKISEIVLAITPSVEGETTLHFIYSMLENCQCSITRIGLGIPFGCELEYLDEQTLKHAFQRRVHFNNDEN